MKSRINRKIYLDNLDKKRLDTEQGAHEEDESRGGASEGEVSASVDPTLVIESGSIVKVKRFGKLGKVVKNLVIVVLIKIV